jgi:hypothetical protein
MKGGAIRRAVAEGRTEDLKRLLQTPENIAHINAQGLVSHSFLLFFLDSLPGA